MPVRIATSTNLYELKDNGSLFSVEESLRACRNAGYRVFDLDLCEIRRNDCFLIGDNWEQRTYDIGNEAAKLGVEFSQSHIPYYLSKDPIFLDEEKHKWFEGMCERAYIVSGMLNVKWTAVHAFTAMEENCSLSKSKELNIRYFDKYFNLCKKIGLGIAIENMCDFYGSPVNRRYTATYEELIDLVDTINDPLCGITWDTGHANIMEYDQAKALRAIGKRLKAMHVNDNYGHLDIHNIPFMGTVKWHELIPVLTEIGYEGDITFEAFGISAKMPNQLKSDAIKLSYKIGEYLLSLL